MFQLFALSPGPALAESCGRSEFIEAVLRRSIAVGCLIGTYEREPKMIAEDDNAVAVAATPIFTTA